MPTGDISCCSPLDHFQLLDVGLCIWVPYCAGIFNQWSDKREISLLFDGNTADVKIFPDKGCLILHILVFYPIKSTVINLN